MTSSTLSASILTRRSALRVVAGAAVTPVLAACGAPSASQPTKPPQVVEKNVTPAAPASTQRAEVAFWYNADTPEQEVMWKDLFQKFQLRFPDFQVNGAKSPSDTDAKLLASFAAGGAGLPDAFSPVDSGLSFYNDNKMLVSLEDRFKSWKYADDILPELVPNLRGGRKSNPVLMMPTFLVINMLFIRPDWLTELKMQPPDTLDDMLEVAKAYTKPPERYGYGFRGGDWVGLLTHVNQYWKANGVEIIKEDGTIDIDSPEGIDTFDWYISLATKHKVAQPSAVSDKFAELFAGYEGGKIGLLHHHIGSAKQHDDAMHEKADAVMIPRGKVRRWVLSQVTGTAIFKTSKVQDAAWELAAFLSEPESMRRVLQARWTAPFNKSILGDAIFKENKYLKLAQDSISSSGTNPGWHPAWNALITVHPTQLQLALQQQITPAEAVKNMAAEMRKVKWSG